jgi:hypothetical protein
MITAVTTTDGSVGRVIEPHERFVGHGTEHQCRESMDTGVSYGEASDTPRVNNRLNG